LDACYVGHPALRASLRLFRIASADLFGQDRYGKLRTLRWRGHDGRACASCACGIDASPYSIVSSKDPAMIKKILGHLVRRAACRSAR
jgi:hypothetical protein